MFASRLRSRWRLAPLTAALACVLTTPTADATSWPVTSCGDAVGSATTLRGVIGNTMTLSHDNVDLSQLPNTCSTITLSQGEIPIPQFSLTVVGPASATVSIDGGANSRIFNHSGSGSLYVNYLTVENGRYAGIKGGGCIRSAANVTLSHSTITNCLVTIAGPTGFIYGGGAIYALGEVELISSALTNNTASAISVGGRVGGGGIYASKVELIGSTVSGNSAKAVVGTGSYAAGGAIHATQFYAKYSTLSSNSSLVGNSVANSDARGGAVWTRQSLVIRNSTISNNSAYIGGALAFAGVGSLTAMEFSDIQNSTISDNDAKTAGGLFLEPGHDQIIDIENSTIAFNKATGVGPSGVGGISVFYKGELSLYSTIVSNNTEGSANVPSDLYNSMSLPATLGGDSSLIGHANVSLTGITVSSADPQLGPLQANGGPTFTRALMPGSPAIGLGNNGANAIHDQRGVGHPRSTGALTTDIGAFEFDAIFSNKFE